MNLQQSINLPVVIAADHPSLAGHFPGNPVVPAVVILDHVRQCIEQWLGDPALTTGLKSAKFLAPLSMQGVSEQHLQVNLQRHQGCVHFHCLQGEVLIASGQWQHP